MAVELVEPVKRVEHYLYALCVMDFNNIPIPRSRLEFFAHALITGVLPEFQAETREEVYITAIITGDYANLPLPKSRADQLLYKICLGETEIRDIELETRYEMLLAYIAEHGDMPLETILVECINALQTIPNTVEVPVKSAILKGQTLINCVDNSKVTVTDATKDNDTYTLNKSILYSRLNFNTDQSLLQINKTYTIILKDVVGSLENIYISGNGAVRESLSTGVAKVTIISEASQNRHLWIENRLATSGEVSFKVMIIEGDYTNEDIPYFEGMQSVQMPVLTTTGKNLWDNKVFEDCPIATINNDGSITLNGTLQGHWMFNYTIDKGTYCASANGNDNAYIHLFWQGYDVSFQQKNPFTIPEKITQRGYITRGTYDNVNIKLQLEVGTQATTYEPYKSNILTVNEDVTLRSNGNVYDELDLLTGKLIQRIDEDGSVLTQEVVKTVDLTITDQDGNAMPCLSTFNDATHVSINAVDIIPQVDLEVRVDANTMANVASQQENVAVAQASLSDAIDAQNDDIEMTKQALDEVKGE